MDVYVSSDYFVRRFLPFSVSSVVLDHGPEYVTFFSVTKIADNESIEIHGHCFTKTTSELHTHAREAGYPNCAGLA